MDAASYMSGRNQLLGAVMESFERLAAAYDLVLVEGAGSPAEINLRQRDIARITSYNVCYTKLLRRMDLVSFSPYTEYYVASPITQG